MPIDKVQSKWDLDHARQQRDLGEAAIKSNEPEPTSKAVVWPKVKHIDGYSFSNIQLSIFQTFIGCTELFGPTRAGK